MGDWARARAEYEAWVAKVASTLAEEASMGEEMKFEWHWRGGCWQAWCRPYIATYGKHDDETLFARVITYGGELISELKPQEAALLSTLETMAWCERTAREHAAKASRDRSPREVAMAALQRTAEREASLGAGPSRAEVQAQFQQQMTRASGGCSGAVNCHCGACLASHRNGVWIGTMPATPPPDPYAPTREQYAALETEAGRLRARVAELEQECGRLARQVAGRKR